MTVVSEGPLCLKIHLSKFELKKYFTSYDKIQFQDPQVKKTIECLFDAATSTLSFETAGKRMIEVYPTASGGCILKFTTEPNLSAASEATGSRSIRLKGRSREVGAYVFAFSDFEALLQALGAICRGRRPERYYSSVYRTRQRYYLHIVIPLFDRTTALQLGEFCDFSARGESALGLLQERALPVIEGDAITKLCAAFYPQEQKERPNESP